MEVFDYSSINQILIHFINLKKYLNGRNVSIPQNYTLYN